jgi:hypothetical protein
MKRLVMMAVLGLASPALADDKPVALDDTQLGKVAAGGDSLAPALTFNVNASPIILVQNAYAVNTQVANTGLNGWARNGNNGQGNGCNKAKKNGQGQPAMGGSTGNIAQWATATAFNVATINYSVQQTAK